MKTAKPDLLLINPGNRLHIYQALGSQLSAIEPPVWAGLMASFVSQKGYRVEILDANAEDLTPECVASRVKEIQPMLIGIVVYGHNPSASTQVMPSASAICTAIKRELPQSRVLLIGGHVSALPERTLKEDSANFVATGEGLYTLLDLVQAFRESDLPALDRVRGLGYWRDGQPTFTAPAPLVRDLNGEIPGIAWDLLPMHLYRAHNWHCFGNLNRQPYAALYTTLGCPYHCSFCCIQAPFKSGEKVLGLKESVNSYRFWSPDQVLAQIDLLVNNYGVRNFKFADEMFVLNPKHVLGICDGIIERGYDLNVWAYARVDTVRDNMVEKLRRAGFRWLAFGIEAASERVRDDVEKGFDQTDIVNTIEKVRNADIYLGANYIFGLPEDDIDSMQSTLDLAIDINAEYSNFYSTMAYPGSRLYNLALERGWPLPASWSGYSQHSADSLPLPTRHISGAEVLKFRDHAFQEYFSNPLYLQSIQAKFGSETVKHIEEMKSIPLHRQIVDSSTAKNLSKINRNAI